MDEYDGRQFVGIDLHRQRSVIVRQSESGEQLSAVRIVNDPVALEQQLEQAGAVERVGRAAEAHLAVMLAPLDAPTRKRLHAGLAVLRTIFSDAPASGRPQRPRGPKARTST